jgi:hypothetical protein
VVANRDYGGLQQMFAAHDWDAGDRVISQIAPTLVVATYGSVAAFEMAHPAILPHPIDTIEQEEPDVWLTSYYGFTPESWGLLGFTQEWMRRQFLENSRPGALVVIYGAGGAHDPGERGRILGIQQQSHIRGRKRNFVPAERWAVEATDQGRRDKWDFALKASRAWRVTAESRPRVEEFAPETYSPGAATLIGARGRKLKPAEARAILDLDLLEVPVYGGAPVEILPAEPAADVLRPSQAGPVSQSCFMTRESEGPKHLYILEMQGNIDHLMGKPSQGRLVVKVGFSRSPDTRRLNHNRALPSCAFTWQLMRSTYVEGRKPFPSSGHALAGEGAMKAHLEKNGSSLGGEFFLARPEHIDTAWAHGLIAAEEWTSS